MANIIWLASYPKSGNTWVRAFLLNFLNDGEGPQALDALHQFALGDMDARFYSECLGRDVDKMTHRELAVARPKVQAHIAASMDGNPLVKTHSNYRLKSGDLAINPAVTQCAIYIVRNPLDTVVSFADHYGSGIDGAIEASCSPSHFIPADPGRVPQYIGSWSTHVAGWLSSDEFPRMLLRYEDAIRDPRRAFRQMVKFLKLDDDPSRLDRAVERSSFKQLQKMEQDGGFAEKSPNSRLFFRSGSFGGWRTKLNKRQIEKVLNYHGPVMKRLGYLRDDGTISF